MNYYYLRLYKLKKILFSFLIFAYLIKNVPYQNHLPFQQDSDTQEYFPFLQHNRKTRRSSHSIFSILNSICLFNVYLKRAKIKQKLHKFYTADLPLKILYFLINIGWHIIIIVVAFITVIIIVIAEYIKSFSFWLSNELSASFVSTEGVGYKRSQLFRANAKITFTFNFLRSLTSLCIHIRKFVILYADLPCTHHFHIG